MTDMPMARYCGELEYEIKRLRLERNQLDAQVRKLRSALETIAKRLPEKWPDQAIARAALNEEAK